MKITATDRYGANVLKTGTPADTRQTVVACFGASYTEAKGSYDWIGALKQKPCNASFRFYNFGIGGDLAYNGLQRLPDVINCHPDRVVVLFGTNDVMTLVSKKLLWYLRRWKHISRDPSPDWYRENMQAIVNHLKKETQARIALCSLPPIGEDPTSNLPFQATINRLIIEHNVIIKQISIDEEVSYIPVYERMQEQILGSPGQAFAAFNFLPLYRNAFNQYVLHKSLDEIGRRNGWFLHTDGIHLNSRGGKLLADLVQEFLNS